MKKIVVVDDNDVFLETVKDFVESQKDFNCVTFLNPESALKYVIESKDVHAVVSDFEMPQMNGLILVKQIIEVLPAIKIIVMSGRDTNYLKKQALKAEIDDDKVQFLCKSNIINLCVLLNN